MLRIQQRRRGGHARQGLRFLVDRVVPSGGDVGNGVPVPGQPGCGKAARHAAGGPLGRRTVSMVGIGVGREQISAAVSQSCVVIFQSQALRNAQGDPQLRQLHGVGTVRLGTGEGAGGYDCYRGKEPYCRYCQHTGLPCNQSDALPQTAGSAAHSGSGLQKSGRRAAGSYQIHQSPAIGQTLRLPQAMNGTFVAGEFTVPPGQCSCPPHQWVEPIQAQADSPHQGPPGVAVAPVGQFVGQDVAQPRRVLQTRGCHIDPLAEQSHKTGGGHRVGDVNGHRTCCTCHGLSRTGGPAAEDQVDAQKPNCHHRCAAQP